MDTITDKTKMSLNLINRPAINTYGVRRFVSADGGDGPALLRGKETQAVAGRPETSGDAKCGHERYPDMKQGPDTITSSTLKETVNCTYQLFQSSTTTECIYSSFWCLRINRTVTLNLMSICLQVKPRSWFNHCFMSLLHCYTCFGLTRTIVRCVCKISHCWRTDHAKGKAIPVKGREGP
jgi:hypothetical protein